MNMIGVSRVIFRSAGHIGSDDMDVFIADAPIDFVEPYCGAALCRQK